MCGGPPTEFFTLSAGEVLVWGGSPDTTPRTDRNERVVLTDVHDIGEIINPQYKFQADIDRVPFGFPC